MQGSKYSNRTASKYHLAAVELSAPLVFDSYQRNRVTGSLIVIDAATNETVAAGVILDTEVEIDGGSAQTKTERSPNVRWQGTRVTRPAGGMVLWVELPRGGSALDVHRRALARGISIAPGPIFSAKQRFGSCIRLSCGNPWNETIERAVVTVARLACELSSS